MLFRDRNIHKYTDEQLMSLLSKDNEEAFELLYKRYSYRTKCFFLRMLGGDNGIAEDLNQELFIKVFSSRYDFNKDYKFDSWLFSICYNLCKNRYRHNEVVEEHKQEILHRKEPTENPSFETDYDREVFNKRLKFILSRLPREQLACYSLRYEEEMSIADIANILDCPEGTVKSRLSSAMTTISKYIKEYNFIYED